MNERDPHRHHWLMVTLLFLAYALSFVDRQILTLMVDPIKRDLGISDTGFSLLHGMAFALFYTALGIPFGRLADRTRRTTLAAAGVAGWSMMTAACGVASNYWQLFLARMGVGVGEATLSPAAYSLLADTYPKEKLGRAVSLYSLGMAAGMGLALLLGGFVIRAVAAGGDVELPLLGALRPWQAVFVVLGIAGSPLALALAWLREPARTGRRMERASWSDLWRFILGHGRLFPMAMIGLSLLTATVHGSLAWVPSHFMRVHEWSAQDVGIRFGSLVLVGGACGLLFGSWLSEKLHGRGHTDALLRVVIISGALCVPIAIASAMATDPAVQVLLYGLLHFADMMPWGIAGAALQIVTPNELRGQISAIYLFTINIIGLGLGPTLVAVLSDVAFDGQLSVALATTICILAPLSCLLVSRSLMPYRRALGEARAWS